MGDDLVDHVLAYVSDVVKANGLNGAELRPVIDAIVNALRRGKIIDFDANVIEGLDDEQIRAIFSLEDNQPRS